MTQCQSLAPHTIHRKEISLCAKRLRNHTIVGSTFLQFSPNLSGATAEQSNVHLNYSLCYILADYFSNDATVKTKHPFQGMLNLGMKSKRGQYVFRLFFKIALCSATSLKRSRREFFMDVDEPSSILKNDHTLRKKVSDYKTSLLVVKMLTPFCV